jgi:hypothetical protein
VIEKMTMVTQYAFSGDYTRMFLTLIVYPTLTPFAILIVEAIEKGVAEVAKFDAGMPVSEAYSLSLFIVLLDDWCVIAITDANFGRYQVTEDDLKRAMNSNPKVHTVLVCIGDGAEMRW